MVITNLAHFCAVNLTGHTKSSWLKNAWNKLHYVYLKINNLYFLCCELLKHIWQNCRSIDHLSMIKKSKVSCHILSILCIMFWEYNYIPYNPSLISVVHLLIQVHLCNYLAPFQVISVVHLLIQVHLCNYLAPFQVISVVHLLIQVHLSQFQEVNLVSVTLSLQVKGRVHMWPSAA